MNLVLSDPLHLVVQGEGIHLGKKMLLIRLVGCNIKCKDCDTDYVWDPKRWNKKEFLRYELSQLVEEILFYHRKYQIQHLLITGGEPGLWENPLYLLIKELIFYNFQFDLETSGYFDFSKIKEFQDQIYFNISPKIGDLVSDQLQDPFSVHILKRKPKHYIIKIVVNKNQLNLIYKNILKLQQIYKIPSKQIYLMPKATTREELLQQAEEIINFCLEKGFEFSPRLHILLFDTQRLK